MAKIPGFTFFTTLGAVGGGFILLKYYIIYPYFRDYFNGPTLTIGKSLSDKTIIITGATGGIGSEFIKEVAQRGAKVIMACRDLEKCENIRKDVVLLSKNCNIVCKHLNMASFHSIQEFASNLSNNLKIDYLINNAAIMNCPKAFTQEGFEAHFGVNYLSHFYLTCLLMGHKEHPNKLSQQPKLLNIIDSSCKNANLELNEIETDLKSILHTDVLRKKNKGQENFNILKNYNGLEAYKNSKYAILLWSQELAKRFSPGIKVYCVDPGITNTRLHRYFNYQDSVFARYTWKPLFNLLFMKDAKHAAQSILYAIYDAEFAASDSSHDPSNTCNEEVKASEKFNKITHLSSQQPSDKDVIFITTKRGKFLRSKFPEFDPSKAKELWEYSMKWIS